MKIVYAVNHALCAFSLRFKNSIKLRRIQVLAIKLIVNEPILIPIFARKHFWTVSMATLTVIIVVSYCGAATFPWSQRYAMHINFPMSGIAKIRSVHSKASFRSAGGYRRACQERSVFVRNG